MTTSVQIEPDSIPAKRKTLAEAQSAVITIAKELAHSKDGMSQFEYLKWESETQDRLRVAVFVLEKIEQAKK